MMPDDVAEKLGADIILPESCVKPEYKQSTRFLDFLHWRRPKIEVRTYRGPVVFGIREVSRTLDLHSSYTLIEHAPWESIQLEIAPFAMEQARKLRTACEDGNYDEVIELLGLVPRTGSMGRGQRLGIHLIRAHRCRGCAQSGFEWLPHQTPLHQQRIEPLAGEVGIQALHSGWFQDSRFCPCRRRLPQSVSGAGRRRIRLAASGPGDQFGSVPEGFGRALPNPNVRRLASLHAGVHRRGGRPSDASHRRAKRLLDGQRGSRGSGGEADRT